MPGQPGYAGADRGCAIAALNDVRRCKVVSGGQDLKTALDNEMKLLIISTDQQTAPESPRPAPSPSVG